MSSMSKSKHPVKTQFTNSFESHPTLFWYLSFLLRIPHKHLPKNRWNIEQTLPYFLTAYDFELFKSKADISH